MHQPTGQKTLVLALVGQPNCGKSTLFNAIAGFKAQTGNYPGTTVSFTESSLHIGGIKVRVVDLPGAYSISPLDSAEKVTRDFILSNKADAIIAVVDASVLSRSIEFVLQLIEMGRPMVVALNMMDEAERKGIIIDVEKLSTKLGLPVIPTIASKGKGVREVFISAIHIALHPKKGIEPTYDKDIEEAIGVVSSHLPNGLVEKIGAPPRFLAVRVLEGDEVIEEEANRLDPTFLSLVDRQRQYLANLHNWPKETVFSSHRHAVSLDIFESVAKVIPRKRRSIRDSLDEIVMHPFWGLLIAIIAFAFLFFSASFTGNAISGILIKPLEDLADLIPKSNEGVVWAMIRGIADGITGGAGIVLPYLIPLLFILSLYEDIGYLPRMAFLVDGILHKIGLHGKAIIPLILGYGCNIPGILATRIMETERDRKVSAILTTLIACSARTVVILALIGAYLGPLYTLFVYLLDIFVVSLVAKLFAYLLKGESLGILMDVPVYRLPPVLGLLKKVWFKISEFIIHAWPILIAASLLMAILQYIGVSDFLNTWLSPITNSLMGLPEAVGVCLFFGILRKELSLILLFQALGTEDVSSVLTTTQILTFSIFVTFYIPCIPTITTLWREVGFRWTMISLLTNTLTAILLATLVRFLMQL